MYYRIRETHSISYLNGEDYNNELKTLDDYVNSIGNRIRNKDDEFLNNIIRYKHQV